ncbi:MAG: hypothetical protein ACREQ5_20225 [Candidatus Dormibacteria bacterium]
MTPADDRTAVRKIIYNDIDEERARHATLCDRNGWQNCDDPDRPSAIKLQVLVEEVGEVARALNDGSPVNHLITELVHVGAVTVAWLEDVYEGMVAGPPRQVLPPMVCDLANNGDVCPAVRGVYGCTEAPCREHGDTDRRTMTRTTEGTPLPLPSRQTFHPAP